MTDSGPISGTFKLFYLGTAIENEGVTDFEYNVDHSILTKAIRSSLESIGGNEIYVNWVRGQSETDRKLHINFVGDKFNGDQA